MPQWPYTQLPTLPDTGSPPVSRRPPLFLPPVEFLTPNLRRRRVNGRPLVEAGDAALTSPRTVSATRSSTVSVAQVLFGQGRALTNGTLPRTVEVLTFNDFAVQTSLTLEVVTDAIRRSFDAVVRGVDAAVESEIRGRMDLSGRPVTPPPFEPPPAAGRLISFDDED